MTTQHLNREVEAAVAEKGTTSPELLALIEKARGYKMNPQEVFEQRVSFVFGMLSSRSTLTKDDVRRMLIEMNGIPANTDNQGDGA